MSKIDVKKIFIQFLKFIAISGIGWLIDFSIFTILSKTTDIRLIFINMISATPATIYVFLLSSKRIFKNQNSKLNMPVKCMIYLAYQFMLIIAISALGELIYGIFQPIITIPYILDNLKMIIKIFITPITMVLNFTVTKNLAERL